MIKNTIAWIKSIYWLPVLAVILLAVSLVLAVFGIWAQAFYFLLVGVFVLLLRLSDR